MNKIKNEYQSYFRNKCFTHHITLEPSNLNEKNILKHLNKIEFRLNKTFLKSSFPKYKQTDTFRFFIFPEDKDLELQHFHILLYSPTHRDKTPNTDRCVACSFRTLPFYRTCEYCTSRELHRLFNEELFHVDRTISLTSQNDHYDNVYATKKQKFNLEYADSYLVTSR